MDKIVTIAPKITVLMPVYNCELYIKEAVDSIVNQTYTNFEFLIIDDASTDKTVSILKSYNDARIQLVEKSANTGLTNSLNMGFALAKGKYIARMDGDDISVAKRFEQQVAFLEANPDVVLCGSWFKVIGSEVVIKLPENNEAIKLALLKGNCIAHPSVMMRKQILAELPVVYNVSKEPAEDYDLWVRLLSFGKLHNLQEVLLNYRVHSTQVSQKRMEQQIQSALEARFEMLKYLNYSFDTIEISLLKKMMTGSLLVTIEENKNFIVFKEKMVSANSNNFFDYNGFEKYLFELQRSSLKKYFVDREKYYPNICFQYFEIRNNSRLKLRLIDELKLIIKSLIYFKRR